MSHARGNGCDQGERAGDHSSWGSLEKTSQSIAGTRCARIQERKAKLKDLFGGYLGSTGKTPDLLCLEESFPERLHT
jgi:hypothetical protein